MAHLPAGYSYLVTRDYRLNIEHPPLAKLMCALPLLALHPTLPLDTKAWRLGNEWAFGTDFFKANKAILRPMLAWSRLPMALLTGIMVAVLGAWVAEVYGLAASWVAMIVLGANPEVLNQGRWVATDLPSAAFGLFTLYASWRWLKRPSWKTALTMGTLLGASVASKDSGLILPLMMIGQALAFWGSGRPMPKLGQWALAIASCVLAPIAILMACYASFEGPIQYAHDLAQVNSNHRPFYPRYLLGHMTYGTYPQYFLVAWLVKTPFPLLICAIVGIGALLVSTVVAARAGRRKLVEADVWDGAALLFAIVLIFGLMTWKADDIGVRYVLAALPLFAWLCGRAFAQLPRPGKALLLVLAIWGIGDAWRAWPDLDGAFDEFLPAPTVAYLDDSNLDWGEGLIALKSEMDRLGLARIRYGSTFMSDPALYGVRADRVSIGYCGLLPAGWYAFSPNFLLRTPGFLWLAYRRPDFNADGLWMYHLEGNVASQAHHTYLQLVRSRPDDPFLWYHVAAMDQAAGNLAGARTDLNAALSIWPGFLQARSMRAAVLKALGDTRAANADDAVIREVYRYVLTSLQGKGPGTFAWLLLPLGR